MDAGSFVSPHSTGSGFIQNAILSCIIVCFFTIGCYSSGRNNLKLHDLGATDMFRDERGTSAIEFAILAPVMLLLLFGMIAYGIYFGASHSIQQIAADAARTALAGLTPAERSSLASNYIKQNASGYAFINPSDLTISVGDSKADPDQFNVNITYDAHNLPIWNLLGDMQLPGETISRHSTIRIGGI